MGENETPEYASHAIDLIAREIGVFADVKPGPLVRRLDEGAVTDLLAWHFEVLSGDRACPAREDGSAFETLDALLEFAIQVQVAKAIHSNTARAAAACCVLSAFGALMVAPTATLPLSAVWLFPLAFLALYVASLLRSVALALGSGSISPRGLLRAAFAPSRVYEDMRDVANRFVSYRALPAPDRR